MIIGCSGAGKSTLARQLGPLLALPVVHLDQLYWLPGWRTRSRADFDALLDAELAKPRWLMDGNFDRTLAHRLAACDTVIYLDYPRHVCLRRVGKRVLSNWGHRRPDMADGCPEKLDIAFLGWVWGFRRRYSAKYDALLAGCGRRVYRFRSPKACEAWVRALQSGPSGR